MGYGRGGTLMCGAEELPLSLIDEGQDLWSRSVRSSINRMCSPSLRYVNTPKSHSIL
jgi:hypothetical protein